MKVEKKSLKHLNLHLLMQGGLVLASLNFAHAKEMTPFDYNKDLKPINELTSIPQNIYVNFDSDSNKCFSIHEGKDPTGRFEKFKSDTAQDWRRFKVEKLGLASKKDFVELYLKEDKDYYQGVIFGAAEIKRKWQEDRKKRMNFDERYKASSAESFQRSMLQQDFFTFKDVSLVDKKQGFLSKHNPFKMKRFQVDAEVKQDFDAFVKEYEEINKAIKLADPKKKNFRYEVNGLRIQLQNLLGYYFDHGQFYNINKETPLVILEKKVSDSLQKGLDLKGTLEQELLSAKNIKDKKAIKIATEKIKENDELIKGHSFLKEKIEALKKFDQYARFANSSFHDTFEEKTEVKYDPTYCDDMKEINPYFAKYINDCKNKGSSLLCKGFDTLVKGDCLGLVDLILNKNLEQGVFCKKLENKEKKLSLEASCRGSYPKNGSSEEKQLYRLVQNVKSIEKGKKMDVEKHLKVSPEKRASDYGFASAQEYSQFVNEMKRYKESYKPEDKKRFLSQKFKEDENKNLRALYEAALNKEAGEKTNVDRTQASRKMSSIEVPDKNLEKLYFDFSEDTSISGYSGKIMDKTGKHVGYLTQDRRSLYLYDEEIKQYDVLVLDGITLSFKGKIKGTEKEVALKGGWSKPLEMKIREIMKEKGITPSSEDEARRDWED